MFLYWGRSQVSRGRSWSFGKPLDPMTVGPSSFAAPAPVYVKETAYWITGERLGEDLIWFLAGYLGSRVFDWWARCVVDRRVLPSLFTSFPVPEFDPQNEVHVRLAAVAKDLTTESSHWPDHSEMSSTPVDREEALANVDALSAAIAGLGVHHVETIMRSFHPSWDYGAHLDRTLRLLSDLEAEAQ